MVIDKIATLFANLHFFFFRKWGRIICTGEKWILRIQEYFVKKRKNIDLGETVYILSKIMS